MGVEGRQSLGVKRFCALAWLSLCAAALAPAAAEERPQSALLTSLVTLHNAERMSAGVDALVWDDRLAAHAARWAESLARADRMEHDEASLPLIDQGENLWMGTRGAFAADDMVADWARGRAVVQAGRFPHVSRTGNWHDVAHYTQMLWPDTRTMGCAIATNARHDYVVCRYWPAGNRTGAMFAVQPGKTRVAATSARSFELASISPAALPATP